MQQPIQVNLTHENVLNIVEYYDANLAMLPEFDQEEKRGYRNKAWTFVLAEAIDALRMPAAIRAGATVSGKHVTALSMYIPLEVMAQDREDNQ